MQKTEYKYFTMIELAIVMLISLLVSTLIFASGAVAKNTAKDDACRSNLNELTKIVLSYASENNDYIFAFNNGHASWAGHPDNANGSPYIKYASSQKKFKSLRICPLAQKENNHASYGIAGELGMWGGSPATTKFFRTVEVERPEEFYLFMEMENKNSAIRTLNSYRAWWLGKPELFDPNETETCRFAYRHGDGMLIATLAGTVEELPYDQVASDKAFMKSRVFRDGMYGANFFK